MTRRNYCTPEALCPAHEAGAPAGPCGLPPIPAPRREPNLEDDLLAIAKIASVNGASITARGAANAAGRPSEPTGARSIARS